MRTGKRPNGLTYFIRHNAKPEKSVELRLAVNAGSVDEDNDQRGMGPPPPLFVLPQLANAIGVNVRQEIIEKENVRAGIPIIPRAVETDDQTLEGLRGRIVAHGGW